MLQNSLLVLIGIEAERDKLVVLDQVLVSRSSCTESWAEQTGTCRTCYINKEL
jgi:hypothetical protein